MGERLKDIDVLILCGGKGERLRPVSGACPKVLMPVAGRPFIDLLLEDLAGWGFRRFILSTGHLKAQVRRHFEGTGPAVEFSDEDSPLGTGGAVKKAEGLITSPCFLVMNGDSMCKTDFARFYGFHRRKRGMLTAVLARAQSGTDYGVVSIDDEQRITRFKEKTPAGEKALVNAGIYMMNRAVFLNMPEQETFSLEYDLFPRVVELGFYGFITDGHVIDIGTPERYQKANKLLGS